MTYDVISVAYFNGAHDKLAETLKLLERYQEENRDEIEKPSILETAETNGKFFRKILAPNLD